MRSFLPPPHTIPYSREEKERQHVYETDDNNISTPVVESIKTKCFCL